MRRVCDICDLRAVECRCGEDSESIPAAEAVTCGGDAGNFQFSPDVGRGFGDDGVRGEGLVAGEELGDVEPWNEPVDVVGRGFSIEEVGDDGYWRGV